MTAASEVLGRAVEGPTPDKAQIAITSRCHTGVFPLSDVAAEIEEQAEGFLLAATS